MSYCLSCTKETKNPKFCSRLCAAQQTIKTQRKHGPSVQGKCIDCALPITARHKRCIPCREQRKTKYELGQCSKCGKPRGKNRYCDPCWNEYIKQYYRSHPDKYGKMVLLPSNQVRTLLDRLRRYNITEEEFFSLLRAQNELCALCGQRPPTDIDHDHKTNKVRGLLCGVCNRGLGHFDDSTLLLHKAINYLEKHTQG